MILATVKRLTGNVNGVEAQNGAAVFTYWTEILYGPDGPHVTLTGFEWFDPLMVPFVTDQSTSWPEGGAAVEYVYDPFAHITVGPVMATGGATKTTFTTNV